MEIKITDMKLLSISALLARKAYVIPKAWIKPSTTVPYRVTLAIFLRPSSPSLLHASNVGITAPNNCMIIDALMYGVILIAKIENLLNAPPANKSSKPNKLPLVNKLSITDASTPGTGIWIPKRKTMNISNV